MTSPELIKNSKVFGLIFALCFFIPVAALSILVLNSVSTEHSGVPSVSSSSADYLATPATVTLKNDTSYPIARLLFSGSEASIEILTPLEPQESGTFAFQAPSDQPLPCTLDATVVYRDGEEAKMGSFDFCSNRTSTLLIRYQADSQFE